MHPTVHPRLGALPDQPRLLRELRLLERQTHRSGKDSVDHGRNGYDDHANAACGVLNLVARLAARPRTKIVSPLFYSKQLGWFGDGQANTPPPPGYQRTHEPWRDYVGGSDPFAREW